MEHYEEYPLPREAQGVRAFQEHHPPAETASVQSGEYPASAEQSDTAGWETPPPGTPDGIDPPRKSRLKRWLPAILLLAVIGAAIPEFSGTASVDDVTVPTEDVTVQVPSETVPDPTAGTEESLPTEPARTDLEILLEVGTWVSPDGIYVHFGENGGWWKDPKITYSYGTMHWRENEELHVDYNGTNACIGYMEDSSGVSEVRSAIYRHVTGTVEVIRGDSGYQINLQNPFGSEEMTYLPAENEAVSGPAVWYSEPLWTYVPGTSWQVAPFSSTDADRANAEATLTSVVFISLTAAEFGDGTCTLTFSDNYGGSKSFDFTWEPSEEEGSARIILRSDVRLEYTLQYGEGNGTTTYSIFGTEFFGYLAVGEDGLVFFLPNPFSNFRFGAEHEIMIQ